MSLRDDARTWDSATILLMLALTIGGVGGLVVWAGARLWSWWTGNVAPMNPFELVLALTKGELPNSVVAWGFGVGAGAAAVGLGVWVWASNVRVRKRGDDAARLAGSGSDIEALTISAAAKKAKRLGVSAGIVGLPIGRSIAGGVELVSSFEDVGINISGPRTGKTTCWVVPRILQAPGAVVATSNKRDIVDITCPLRARGGRTWVFDPQGICDEPRTWWWNPLRQITNAVEAKDLAQVFVDSTRAANATTNAYFDGAAQDVITALLLAGGRGNKTLRDVYRWVTDPDDREPLRILERSGEAMAAQSLASNMGLVAETRSGVYGSAGQVLSFLLNEAALAWVEPGGAEEFIPEEFVSSSDTLYCLSQEGKGSASPIVTALTVAVVQAALVHAKAQANGRVATPMLIELDEAANVCRWRDLPDLYSHLGSRGICVDTILQSWSQGAHAWGDAGIRKLWSASNVKVYGGGVSERDFLSQLSDLIGVHYVDAVSTSTSIQGRSTSTSRASQQRPIATVSDLQALPAGRAWVFASGTPAVLAALIPFWQRDKENKS
ncbi:type IV secretory system conjugative DNA transfer family protein [Schaalia cardiffensis]|uniref:type IV secretory system conjugative DNA transfer family protein n=1 Tax=Schaalia cardiffensis TaxID=181487 RepID=UPI0018E87FF4|nr:TraM recognition domain-containing protein [Schaalia cardiffensis]MBJ2329467.1 type IV secretory system conjugative DNA transfer family protein [Schaalia cardiffensis]